ncbi:helix-turn-helix domain-containing protein [Enorma phocaeensis]|uniref:helix-turn-helix domain-containing protein n=1 Tax=Enorma phocaeensis TaxID=1871019 RepID=UPI00235312F7|nr:helix-turn-helix transcriptional regulator [Enorma phocaeensis]
MNFNDRLIDLRRKRGLSQEQLGYELGVSRQTVSKWELAQSYPDFQRLVLLSDYYEMTLDELVKGVDVGDVRSLNESEKQISSIYSDIERSKETIYRAWRIFVVVGCAVLALFALVVIYGVSQGGLFVR